MGDGGFNASNRGNLQAICSGWAGRVSRDRGVINLPNKVMGKVEAV